MIQSRVIFLAVTLTLIGIFWSVGGSQVMDYVPYYVQRLLGKSVEITIGTQTLKVEVERSTRAQTKGLSGRRVLEFDHGMFFPLATAAKYEFWMPDMHFNLDIIWMQGSTIVDISRGVPAPKNGESPARVTPAQPVDNVLEVCAGVAAGWKVGDVITSRYDRSFFRSPV